LHQDDESVEPGMDLVVIQQGEEANKDDL